MVNSKAQAAKEKGNAAFKAGDFPTAIGQYTSAILADKTDVTYPLNRAAAYLKLGKYEDAERDCNTVLGLDKKNVKALFRRGQANAGMTKLREAHQDFSNVLLVEPSNISAQEELQKVAALIQKEGVKKSKTPEIAMNASLEPVGAPQRRRIPIKIIDPANGSSPPSVESSSISSIAKLPLAQAPESNPVSPSTPSEPRIPETSKTTNVSSTSTKPDTLEAVSSRSLKVASSSAVGPVPPSITAAAAALSPSNRERPAPKSSFIDAKQARESGKPSRVGGGIFRSSGQNTIFSTRGESSEHEKSTDSPKAKQMPELKPDPKAQNTVSSQSTSGPEPSPVSAVKSAVKVQKPPANLFDLNKTWSSMRSPEEKWQLINTIPPTEFPTFCKNSLEPGLLSSILEMFVDVLSTDGSIKSRVLDYMNTFAKISRFSTVVLFLSRPEKATAKRVWELLDVDIPAGDWRAVA